MSGSRKDVWEALETKIWLILRDYTPDLPSQSDALKLDDAATYVIAGLQSVVDSMMLRPNWDVGMGLRSTLNYRLSTMSYYSDGALIAPDSDELVDRILLAIRDKSNEIRGVK